MKGVIHWTRGLVDGIQAFLDEIQRSELEHVFRHWIEFDGCWIMAETPSLNKLFIITIDPECALVRLPPLFIDPPVHYYLHFITSERHKDLGPLGKNCLNNTTLILPGHYGCPSPHFRHPRL
jgi:hypothetical protein